MDLSRSVWFVVPLVALGELNFVESTSFLFLLKTIASVDLLCLDMRTVDSDQDLLDLIRTQKTFLISLFSNY